MLKDYLDERTLRIWAATEIKQIGIGGKTIVKKATGLDFKTLNKGLKESEQLYVERLMTFGKETSSHPVSLIINMKRVIIVCEGDTEKEFCTKILSPFFAANDIYIQSPLIKKSINSNNNSCVISRRRLLIPYQYKS